MRKQLPLLIISTIVAIILVASSCTTSQVTKEQGTIGERTTSTTTTTTTTTTPSTTTTTTEQKTTQPVTTSSGDIPKYGGTLTHVELADPPRFDEYFGSPNMFMRVYQDVLAGGDWAKGPAGTKEFTFDEGGIDPPYESYAGHLAESWDLPDPKTIVIHLRQGVHFALDQNNEASRLVNGRELVADDVVKSWERRWTNPSSYQSIMVLRRAFDALYASDKYTVVIKLSPTDPEGRQGWVFQIMLAWQLIEAPEVAKTYGDARDWRHAVGTGPFMLTDYVAGSFALYKRNPNYFMEDPVHPGNRLPYAETYRIAIIPDKSTQLAAFRTGKVDQQREFLWDDASSLIKTNPEIQYHTSFGQTLAFAMRLDKPDLPFFKKEVRQALTMAIDYDGIVNGIYAGQAEWPAVPVKPVGLFKELGAYVELKDLSPEIQAMFSYNPTKAKQMLADAGYPNGFKTSVIILAKDSDITQMVKSYWQAVGVDMDIQIKETAVWSSIQQQMTYPELLLTSLPSGFPFTMVNYQTAGQNNYSKYTGPEIAAQALALDENYFDWPKKSQMLGSYLPNLYDVAAYIGMPAPKTYEFWQPWVKGYSGEWQIGNHYNFFTYVWIDQDLKKSMGK